MVTDIEPAEIREQTAEALAALRETGPLVHCMTNIVVAGFTANVLLAAGASPAMVENADESAGFASVADALLINLGTLSRERMEAMPLAAAAAQDAGTPWVLDPVAVGAIPERTAYAPTLLPYKPSVIRGNPSEIIGLTGGDGGGKGVDAGTGAEQSLEAASRLAAATGAVVAVSGAVDHIVDGGDVTRLTGGVPMMTRVTGVGCALGALTAAFAAVAANPGTAAIAATGLICLAAERAHRDVPGPGTFAVRLIDELAAIEPHELAAGLGL